MVVGAQGGLYNQSSVKIPATEHTYMLILSYGRCLLRNIIISLHMFHVLYIFIHFSDKAIFYN